jgi:phosphatidate cytidylyltransferase/cell division cycle 2-like protein
MEDHPKTTTTTTTTTESSKLTNLQERTGPAIVMLILLSLIVKITGKVGIIGLVYILQGFMYYECTSLVQQRYHHSTTTPVNAAAAAAGVNMTAAILLKWWYFLTAIIMTSGSKLLSNYYYYISTTTTTTTATSTITATAANMIQQRMNFITFSMTSISLIIIVVQLALVKIVPPPSSSSSLSSSNADTSTATTSTSTATKIVKVEDVYHTYLTQITSYIISLLVLITSSSYWIYTVLDYGVHWVLYPTLLVIVNDTMAYFFGILFGKHKLLPHLSPKKTVEGFVGAGISTLAISIPLLKLMCSSVSSSDDVNNLGRHAILLAMYISLVSPFGGFLASAVKRAYGAKDFGSFIPGHGDVIDRLDCQIITAPFVYLYLKNFLTTTTTDSNP